MPARIPLLHDLVDIYTGTDPARERARRWRYEAASKHAPEDLAVTALVSGALSFVMVEFAAPALLLAWLVAVNACTAARFVIRSLIARLSADERRRAETGFTASLLATGILWTLPLFFIIPAEQGLLRAVLLVAFAGASTFAVAAYAFVLEACVLFLLALTIPSGLYLLFDHSHVWQAFAVGCLVFGPTMVTIAARNHVLLLRGYRVQIENAELIEALEEKNRAVEDLNADLEADLERRQLIETDLREAKERAEKFAAELEKLSSLDGLTGIANRRRFDQMLEREWNRARRAGQPLALIMCDIDYFKQYNDHYGHQAGDACLRQLAQLLENSLRRAGDLAARYGGEEFAILLPNTESPHAAELAERIRERLEQIGVPHEASLAGKRLTASFGVAAMVPGENLAPERLLRMADTALYRAKHAGRNRVVHQLGSGDAVVVSGESQLH